MNTAVVEPSVSPPPSRPRARFGRAFWIPEQHRDVGAAGVLQPPRDGAHLHHAGGQSGRAASHGGGQGHNLRLVAAFQSLLPIVTGGYADRFGYKRTLGFALSLMMAGYLMIALLRDVSWINNYWGFFAGILMLAIGTAFFKPSIQGSLAHQMTKANSSVGWGLFYWVVNVGAFIGHYLPTILLSLSVLLPGPFSCDGEFPGGLAKPFPRLGGLHRVQRTDALRGERRGQRRVETETVLQVLWRTLRDVCEPRLISFLAIMSCFWLMMYQLWICSRTSSPTG